MSETAVKLIGERYQALFGGVVASEKSAVKKLQDISDYIDEQNTGFFVLEDEKEKSKLSRKQFAAFLIQLARASENALDIFVKMMCIADDREALLLEIIKKDFFADKQKIKDFFNIVLENNWIGYFRLSEILFEDKKNYWVLVNEIGSASAIYDDNSGSPASPASPTSLISSPSASPVSSEQFVSSLMSPKKQDSQLLQLEHDLKKGCELIVARLITYLKIREKNPDDKKSNVNTLRNIFHNKNLTQTKVENARELIKTLRDKGVSEFYKQLNESAQWNENSENQEHTYSFWKSSGGEYGKCLRDCFSIVKDKKLSLLQYKKIAIEKLSDNAKKEDIIKAKSVDEVRLYLSKEFPSVRQDLNEHRMSKNASLKSPGALKISD